MSYRSRLLIGPLVDHVGRTKVTDEVLAAKVQFVADNGHAGQYWQTRKVATKSVIDKSLQAYITELASYFHTLAQQSSDQVSELIAASVPNDKQLKLLEHEAAEHYERAVAAAPKVGFTGRTGCVGCGRNAWCRVPVADGRRGGHGR